MAGSDDDDDDEAALTLGLFWLLRSVGGIGDTA